MNRKRFGINLDQGTPLFLQEDFELLHVDCFGEINERLVSWMKESKRPLLVGGQIGSGKSTLIRKAFLDAELKPDIELHFDKDALNLDVGDFLTITLIGFLEASMKNQIDLSFCKLPEEFGGFQADDWEALIHALKPSEFSREAYDQKEKLRREIADASRFITSVLEEIGKHLAETLGGSIFIYASGLDKFDPLRAEAIAIQDVVEFLKGFKTLFEVNAVHLFSSSNFYMVDRLLLPVLEEEAIIQMLSKRLGIYAQTHEEELKLIAKWSGGNPRQALRILTYYQVASKKKNKLDSIVQALYECTTDFFAYSAKPSRELMKTVLRDGKIESTLLALPGDRETARQALYGNWILMGGRDGDTAWNAVVNPLVKSTFVHPLGIEDPEIRLLNEYARSSGISPMGLEFSRVDERSGEEKPGEQNLEELLARGVEEPIHANLTEVFDVLQGVLLSKDRKDRVILAYKDSDVADAARSYLFAKANTFEYQQCSHYQIQGGSGHSIVKQLDEVLLLPEVDLLSIEFVGDWEKEQLAILDLQRDRLIQFEMIWWIPYENLKSYLPYWVQLRQLFEIFVLEDELLGSLSVTEIQQDIQFFEELVEEEDTAAEIVIKQLRTVLDYLLKVREGGESDR